MRPTLDRVLARHLGVARKHARALIQGGLVSGDAATPPDGGAPLDDPDALVDPVTLPRDVMVDGQRVRLYDHVTILQHKPLGVVTALRDNRHPTAYGLLAEAPLVDELRPAGRLDLDSTGLLLWSTDGQAIHRWTHPKNAVPRTYEAALARAFVAPPLRGPGGLDDLTLDDGHRPHILALETFDGALAHPALQAPPATAAGAGPSATAVGTGPHAPATSDGALAEPARACAWARITIVGGAYHEVRRIFAALGNHVVALCRVSFGDFTLPRDLPPGAFQIVERAR